mgnify:CR=1 FL=1
MKKYIYTLMVVTFTIVVYLVSVTKNEFSLILRLPEINVVSGMAEGTFFYNFKDQPRLGKLYTMTIEDESILVDNDLVLLTHLKRKRASLYFSKFNLGLTRNEFYYFPIWLIALVIICLLNVYYYCFKQS